MFVDRDDILRLAVGTAAHPPGSLDANQHGVSTSSPSRSAEGFAG